MGNKSKKRHIAWQQCAVMAVFILIGGLCGMMIVDIMNRIAMNGQSDVPELLLFLLMIIAMYLAMIVQIVVHEAGHLVFGLASGYGFCSFRIFSWIWVKEGNAIRFRRLSIAGTGGQCLMSPPDIKDGKIPVMLYNLGGSVMNVVTAVIALCIYFAMPETASFAALLLMFSVIGFGFALVNGVPMRMGGVDNDGYNAFSLGKNPDAMRALWIQLKVNEQISQGVRLCDMPEEWFAVPGDAAMKNNLVAAQGVFACNRLMDEKKFAEADRLMQHMLAKASGMNGIHRNLVICDRIYCETVGENRRETIEGMLTKEIKTFMKQMKTFPSVKRVEYAVALLSEKDTAKAEAIRKQFDKCAKRYPYPGEMRSERELMVIADEKAN